MSSERAWVPLAGRHGIQCLREGRCVRRTKKHTGLAVAYRIEGASARESDNRTAGRVRFQRREAEVLGARENACAAMRKEIRDLPVRQPARKAYGWSSDALERWPCRSVANDHERETAPRARLDGEVDALVCVEARDDEVIIPGSILRLKSIDVDRRKDDVAVASIRCTDAAGYFGGDGDEPIHAPCRVNVPPPQRSGECTRCQSRERAKLRARQIAVQAPRPAHRRIAVAHVHGASRNGDTLGPRGAAAQHEIVSEEVERTDGDGIQRQILLEVLAASWKTLHPRHAHVRVSERSTNGGGIEQRHEDRRVRKHPMQNGNDSFCASGLIQVIVDDRDLHRRACSRTSETFAMTPVIIASRVKRSRTWLEPELARETASFGSLRKRIIAEARAALLPGCTSSAVCMCCTTSRTPPASLATSGFRAINASTRTRPNGSGRVDVCAMRSHADMSAGMSSLAPRSWTRPASVGCAARCRSSFSYSASPLNNAPPTIRAWTSGSVSRASSSTR